MKINLRDTTFILPVFIDSTQRLENLNCILKFISDNFDTNIILVEEDEMAMVANTVVPGLKYIFVPRTIAGIFYRTKVINVGIRAAHTPYIAIWDTDVIVDTKNCYEAVGALRDGRALAAYPYAGDFVDVDRSYIKDGVIKARESFTKDSVGGAVFLNRDAYWVAGNECEKVIGWGHEDRERYIRMVTLGWPIMRTDGRCYHIIHSRPGVNSSNANPYDKANEKVYYRIKKMNKMELIAEIQSWTK